MKKYSSIALIIIATICIGFFLYRANLPYKTNQGSNTSQNTNSISVQESNISDVISDIADQERNTEEILFARTVSDNAFEVYTIGINGKNLNKLLTVNKGNLPHIDVNTDQSTVNYIKNNLDRFKDAFTHPLYVFSKNFYAYSMPIEENDVVSGGGYYKGVFLCNVETNKTVQIDRDLTHQLPSSLFSQDGSLFVSSLSFSHDGKFLFLCSWNYLSVFSIEQIKFTGIFHIDVGRMRNVDRVLNNLYFAGGTDASVIFKFDIEKEELKPLTNCPESTFSVSPDNKNLVFIDGFCLDGKNYLGILNLENGTLKKIDYPKESEITGFVSDSKHLIIKRYYKLSDTDINYHIAIYLLNLNTLEEAKIYAETGS